MGCFGHPWSSVSRLVPRLRCGSPGSPVLASRGFERRLLPERRARVFALLAVRAVPGLSRGGAGRCWGQAGGHRAVPARCGAFPDRSRGDEGGHRALTKRCGAVPELFRCYVRQSRSGAGRSQGGSEPMRGGPGAVRGGPGPVLGRCGAVPGRSRGGPVSALIAAAAAVPGAARPPWTCTFWSTGCGC